MADAPHTSPHQNRFATSRRTFAAGLALSPLLATMTRRTAAAQEASPATSNEVVVTVTADDFSFDIPETIPAGYVTVTMENVGAEPHHAQIVKLNEGISPDDAIAALNENGPLGALQSGMFVGGPGTSSAGISASVILDLEQGDYLLICFLRSPDGTPHYTQGMVTSFTVEEGDGSDASTMAPEADGEVVLDDYSFTTPSQVPAGKTIWKLINNGGQLHELIILKVENGLSTTDVMTALGSSTDVDAGTASEYPLGHESLTSHGGSQGILPGAETYTVLNLEPGGYIASCFVPIPGTHFSHADYGMMKPFVVTGDSATPDASPAS